MPVLVDGESFTLEDVVQVARHNEPVLLQKSAIPRIKSSRAVVETAIKEGRVVYGVNTGFGDLADVSINKDDLASLQVNLIRSHSAGVGPPFSQEVVRGMMLLWCSS